MTDSTNACNIFVSQKLKAFIEEPEGCAVVRSLEQQFQCTIQVVNEMLVIKSNLNVPVDASTIEASLREVWQKRDVQQTIRLAALKTSCTHVCQAILPRAYSAVIILFSDDIRRRSNCSDIIVEHSEGKLDIFGTESSVAAARELVIFRLTDHFGPLEIEIPPPQRTTRTTFSSVDTRVRIQSPLDFSGSAPSAFLNVPSVDPHPKGFDNIFHDQLAGHQHFGGQNGEPNAILSSTPSAPVLSAFGGDPMTAFNKSSVFPPNHEPQQMMFMPNMVPPCLRAMSSPQLQHKFPPHVARINNVEKIRVWISKDDVGKILGNRAAAKKQIEGQFNCVITVRTDCQPHFGMTAVEVMGQNEDQCKNARDAIFNAINSPPRENSPSKTDSGFSSPSNPGGDSTLFSPDKRRRSSFLDQPKVLLALTPRKSPPME